MSCSLNFAVLIRTRVPYSAGIQSRYGYLQPHARTWLRECYQGPPCPVMIAEERRALLELFVTNQTAGCNIECEAGGFSNGRVDALRVGCDLHERPRKDDGTSQIYPELE